MHVCMHFWDKQLEYSSRISSATHLYFLLKHVHVVEYELKEDTNYHSHFCYLHISFYDNEWDKNIGLLK